MEADSACSEQQRFSRVFSNSAEMYFCRGSVWVLYMIIIFFTFMKKKVGFIEGERETGSA